MNSLVKLVTCLFAIVPVTMSAQMDKNFFKKLQTEKITSSDCLKWKQFGPGMAGYCEEFWIHPTNDNVMFMGPDMHVSYGTWDRGHSWQTLKDCDGTGQDMKRVIEMDFSRQNPDFGLALDWNGEVYKTDDMGHTWNCIYKLGKRHSALAVDPNNDKVWYAGAGDFWNVKENHRSLKNLNGIKFKFAAYGHIWKTTDGGKSWKKLTNGIPEGADIGKIIVDPRNSEVVYMICGQGMYKSINGGKSWKVSANGLPNNLPRDLTSYYDKKSKEFILYAIDQTYYEKSASGDITFKGGIYKSTDGAKSWTDITGNMPIDMTKISNGSIKNFQYIKTLSYWFGISTKETYSLLKKQPKSIIPVFNRLVVNPGNKNEIYVISNAKHDRSFTIGEVMKTEDGGKSWIACARTGKYWDEKRDADYWTSRNNPLGCNMKFAHLQKSLDMIDYSAGNRFININSKGDVYIEVDQQTLCSTDGGKTWEQIDDYETEPGSCKWVGRGDSNLPGSNILLNTRGKDRILLCCGEHGLWETTDPGNYPDKSAVAVKQLEGQCNKDGAHSVADVAVNPKNPDEIYILLFRQAHRGHFRVSTDGGKTWTNRAKPIDYNNPNISGNHIYQNSLIVDYDNPNNIYFCVHRRAVTEVGEGSKIGDFDGYGIYASHDGGYNWDMANIGLPDGCSINRLCIDPKNSNVLYAASNMVRNVKGGLYKSVDCAKSWERLDIPTEIKSVNNVFVDKNNGSIYISCGNKGGNVNEGGVWRSNDNGKTWNKIFEMPYVWQTETSILDSDIIIVSSAGYPGYNNREALLNPGAYLSQDGGKTWIKVNKNLGQPDKIVDIKPDINDKNIFWCSLWGSGWYKGIFK